MNNDAMNRDRLNTAADTGTLSTQLLVLATALARSAGETVQVMRHNVVGSASSKSTPTDPVTAADTEAERIIVAGILEARPDDGVAGEEGTNLPGTSGVVWHIDPIDGTTNFVYGIAAYCVSIGVEVDGSMTAGVVYNPVVDELFHAERGGGAFLNGEPIHATTGGELSTALVATGFGYGPERRRAQAKVLTELLPEVRDIRRIGSAALDLCAVACGRVDAYFEAGLNMWDLAAGWLIATEAGAICDDLRGNAPGGHFLLAAGPALHPALVQLLVKLEAERVIEPQA